MDEKEHTEEVTPLPQKEREAEREARQQEVQRDLGKRLLEARRDKGFSLAGVSEQLRIREVYLESLEQGEWSNLPEETYIRGFLRQYADLMGLDINEELDALKPDEYHLTKPFTMPDPPIAPSRKWTIAIAAVFVLLIVIFNVLRNGGDHQGVIAPPAPPPPANTPPAEQSPQTDKTDMAKPEEKTDESSTAAPAQIAEKPVSRFRFTAVGENAWIQIFDHQHTLLKEALLKPGDSIVMDYNGTPLFVTCGNAAALRIDADDSVIAAAGSLGESGKVLRDYKLVFPAPSSTPSK
ncbi:MAG TPA: RodZ domain-containing protein [Mariprofundaceae bacterium]|nr:RodZ domain-containing protein [Mariprofundaceae bacterium]